MRRKLLLGSALFVAGLAAARWMESMASPARAGGAAAISGDVDASGVLDISDPIYLLRYLFMGGEAPAPCGATQDPVSTVVIVRHCEKEDSGVDPGLTPEGQARALRLAQMLRSANVSLLVASNSRRTKETLMPLSELKPGIPLEPIEEAADVADRIQGLPPGSLAVVAHHSFTIPSMLRDLGLEDTTGIDVSGSNYDNFLVLLLPSSGKTQLIHLRY